MIKLEKAVKIYNKNTSTETVALKNVSFEIKQGDFVAITGPSGSGKSTLLNIIAGIDNLTEGEYYFDGQNMTNAKNAELSKLRNRKIGIILQDFGLLGNETVLQNVRLPLIIAGEKGVVSKQRAMDVLATVGLSELAMKKANQISGGQRQRTAIARALAMNSQVILADEPTGALDTTNTTEIAKIMKKVNEKGITIVIVTHNLELASYCKKQYKLVDGELYSF